MIISSDPDYLDTKLVKQGLKKLNPIFQELADWIDYNFQTKVLNIYYEKIKVSKNRPRLSIIFEFENEERRFQTPTGFTDEKKEKIIIDKFIEIVNNNTTTLQKLISSPKFDTDEMFVIFEAFEPIARREVNHRIPQSDIEILKDEFKSKDLWEIYREFEMTVFFFYTNSQIQEHSNIGTIDLLRKKYYELLKMYDTFNYIKPNYNFITFDSKENFDTNFKGNWFYYSRR